MESATGCEAAGNLLIKNFNITERTHKDTQKKDTFSYDGLNRLVTSNLKGRFTKDTYEQFDMYRMNEIDRDIDGMASETKATLNGKLFPADKVTLDEKGKSFVYDFKEEKEIQKIELFKTNLERKSRIRERDLHIYTKQNEADTWSELTPNNWNYVVDPKNQSIHFNLKETLKTRFIKIRTIWDDRDIDNNNVSDYVTFSNESVQKMIRIWTLENERNEEYDYDRNSNRKSITENGKNRSYTYYKNDKNGNTARVMSDGKWYYTYDDNGNRTAKGYKQKSDNDKVVIDETRENWKYTWDYHNRLVKVQQFNAPDNAQNVCVEYTYDANNHRIERISKTNSIVETTQYAYGRNGAITYQKKTIENTITYRTFSYLNNQIIGFIDRISDNSEALRIVLTDIQGSVTEVYDEDNNLLWKSGYTAFGIKAGETTRLLDFDGLYTGCDYDVETGLTYHWNRWRSEDGNSWLSQDPIRDGLNWYGYAGQNPITFVDLNGLRPINEWTWVQPGKPESKPESDPTPPPSSNLPQNEPVHCGGGPSSSPSPEPPKVINYLSNVIIDNLNALFNGDRGEDYRRNANNAFQNGQYVQWFLLSVDGFIEATLDIGLIPSMVITSRIDNFCQDNLGLGLAEMSMTLQSAGLLAPAGELLYHFSYWARANAAISGSSFISTTTNIGVEGLNQAAGLVGVNANSVKLNAGQQGKHIKGHNNYIQGKSVLYGNLDDAQELLTKYAGTGQKMGEQKERVNFGRIIGTYVNPETGEALETTKGIIHYGNKGAHIVPSRP